MNRRGKHNAGKARRKRSPISRVGDKRSRIGAQGAANEAEGGRKFALFVSEISEIAIDVGACAALDRRRRRWRQAAALLQERIPFDMHRPPIPRHLARMPAIQGQLFRDSAHRARLGESAFGSAFATLGSGKPRVKRPPQHQTDDKGDAILRDAFAQWAVNASEKDYGWDYVVEVFRDNISTGLLFNAQLKSSTVTPYCADETFISQSLEIDAAEYLARTLQQPTFLFHSDVEKKRLFWTAVQLDDVLLQSLEKGQTQSLTVRIPTANQLPNAFNRFLKDLRKAHHVVVSRTLLVANDTDFVDAMRGRPIEKLDVVAEDLHEKAFRLEMQTAYDILRKDDFAEAARRLKNILANPVASLAVRFNVTNLLGDVEWKALIRSSEPQSVAAERRLLTGRELCAITRKGPKHLRLFALITRTAAELGIINQKHLGLTMNWKAHRALGEDPLWVAILSHKLDASVTAAGRKYKQALRLAGITARSPFRWVAPLAIIKVAKEITVLAGLLESADFNTAGQRFRDSAFQIFRMAAEIATETNNIDALFETAIGVLTIETSENGDILAWSRSIVGQWNAESAYRKRAEEFTARTIQRLRGVTFETDIRTTDRQVHENLLTAFGLDPRSPRWAEMIDLALKDADPGRVLKPCEHTFVSAGPGNDLMLDRLGLQAAGKKRCVAPFISTR